MRVLIIGAGGYLGGALFSYCNSQKRYFAYGTYLTKPQEGMLYLDIFDTANIRNIIDLIKPDAVVWCILNEKREFEISSIGLCYLLSLLKPNVRFIYLSTALSTKKNQNEETLPEPRDTNKYHSNYVNGKILGEQLVRAHSNHVIIRPGQIYGFGVSGELDERMRRVQDVIAKDGKMVRAANVYISTVHIDDLVLCIVELLDSDFIGTLCISASKNVSYYDFYKFLAREIGISDDRIVPDYENEFSMGYFNTSKAQSMLLTPLREIDM